MHGATYKTYTTKQIEKKLGLNVTTLHYYIQAGIITPDIDIGEGTGNKRILSMRNVFEAGILRQLMNYGLPKKIIVKCFKSIYRAGERDLLDPERIIETGPDDVFYTIYLVFYINDDTEITHRFIKDGGEQKHILKRRDRKAFINKTSSEELESINDYLFFAPVCIVINLKMLAAIFFTKNIESYV